MEIGKNVHRVIASVLATCATMFMLSACGSAPKPEIELPAQPARMSHPYGPFRQMKLDEEIGQRVVTATPVPGSPTLELTSTHKYGYEDDKNKVSYPVLRKYPARRVPERKSWIGFVEGADQYSDLYEVTDDGTVQQLSGGKPVIDLDQYPDKRPSQKLDDSDGRIQTVVIRGLGADGDNGSMALTRYYLHDFDVVKGQYSLDARAQGTYVKRQSGFMAWIDGSLYKMSGSDEPRRLSAKPVEPIGLSEVKLSAEDTFLVQKFKIVRDFGQSRLGQIQNYFNHELTFETEQYYLFGGEVLSEFVPEVREWMFRISNGFLLGYSYYRVNDDLSISQHATKPVVFSSEVFADTKSLADDEYSDSDREFKVLGWTFDGDRMILRVKRHWKNSGTYVNVIYWTQEDGFAAYSGTPGVWLYTLGDITYVFDVDDSGGYSGSRYRRIPVPSDVRNKNRSHKHRRRDSVDDRPKNVSSPRDDRPKNTSSDNDRPKNTASDNDRPTNQSADSSSDKSSSKRKKRRSSNDRPGNSD
jgi:hypothetical protein